MQTLVRTAPASPKNYFVNGRPQVGIGAEGDPALSVATAVEFELRFRPYVQRIYRTALIVTQSPARAKQLEREISQKAWRNYSPMPALEFAQWLTRLLQQTLVPSSNSPF